MKIAIGLFGDCSKDIFYKKLTSFFEKKEINYTIFISCFGHCNSNFEQKHINYNNYSSLKSKYENENLINMHLRSTLVPMIQNSGEEFSHILYLRADSELQSNFNLKWLNTNYYHISLISDFFIGTYQAGIVYGSIIDFIFEKLNLNDFVSRYMNLNGFNRKNVVFKMNSTKRKLCYLIPKISKDNFREQLEILALNLSKLEQDYDVEIIYRYSCNENACFIYQLLKKFKSRGILDDNSNFSCFFSNYSDIFISNFDYVLLINSKVKFSQNFSMSEMILRKNNYDIICPAVNKENIVDLFETEDNNQILDLENFMYLMDTKTWFKFKSILDVNNEFDCGYFYISQFYGLSFGMDYRNSAEILDYDNINVKLGISYLISKLGFLSKEKYEAEYSYKPSIIF